MFATPVSDLAMDLLEHPVWVRAKVDYGISTGKQYHGANSGDGGGCHGDGGDDGDDDGGSPGGECYTHDDLLLSSLVFELSVNCLWLLARSEHDHDHDHDHDHGHGHEPGTSSTSSSSTTTTSSASCSARGHLASSGILDTLVALGR
jgi:hypothetical protein